MSIKSQSMSSVPAAETFSQSTVLYLVKRHLPVEGWFRFAIDHILKNTNEHAHKNQLNLSFRPTGDIFSHGTRTRLRSVLQCVKRSLSASRQTSLRSRRLSKVSWRNDLVSLESIHNTVLPSHLG